MLDRSIPFYNMILKCESYTDLEIAIPKGYYLRNYQVGYEKSWAKLEYEIGDFKTLEMAEKYFVSNYCTIDIKNRCIFILDQNEKIVGLCIAWRDKKENQIVGSLHWLVVSPQYQGNNLGKVLCQNVLKIFWELDGFPVYVHTQPWSYVAIFLYIRLGFKLQVTDTFLHYENQYEQGMCVLKNILQKHYYDELVRNSV